MRRCVILVNNLSAGSKALLLTTLDLYYSNFTNLGHKLEEFYTPYLLAAEDVKPAAPKKSEPAFSVSEPPTTISSLNEITTQLEKRGGGFQRPPTQKNEYVNRPLKASERLKFVRAQCQAEMAKESAELAGKQAGFERSVAETVHSVREPEVDENAPRTTTMRKGLLVAPVSPPKNSDWYADVESHELEQQQESSGSVYIPSPENTRNHGNGSPNKYSKSVSPNRGAGDHHHHRQSNDHNNSGHTGEHHHSQMGRSHDRHLDDLHSKQTMGRGRGRRTVTINNRDTKQAAHSPGKSNGFGGQSKGHADWNSRRNGPDDAPARYEDARATHSDDDADVWDQQLSPKGIYHHSPAAAKYAQEFLQFLDD